MIVHNVEDGKYTEDEDNLKELLRAMEEDTCGKHGRIVQISTEEYRSWNILKQHLLVDTSDFKNQLKINEAALRNNPKSYQAWHHRKFMMKHFPTKKAKYLKRERSLVELLLKYDSRNFHCWNYRMEVLEYREKGGERDLFNYSYLHHHACEESPFAIVYTDPFDRSGWEYLYVYREWMRTSGEVYVRRYSSRTEIKFKEPFFGKLVLRINDETEKILTVHFKTRFIHIDEAIEKNQSIWIVTGTKRNHLVSIKEDQRFINDILEVEPGCYNALSFLLDYTEERSERKKIIEKLIELDSVRRNYYNSLLEEFYETYVTEDYANEQYLS